MSQHLALIALVGVALGVGFVLRQTRRDRAQQTDPIARWEDEGGAVPVAPNRTAAQVPPYGAP
jgi:hypothetical protein